MTTPIAAADLPIATPGASDTVVGVQLGNLRRFRVDALGAGSSSGGATVASGVTYDNTTSGLSAGDVQTAIDELAAEKLDQAAAPELIRDTVGAALAVGPNITINVNDAGDTILISAAGTNLGTSSTATAVNVTSDTGTDIAIPGATAAAAGVMVAADKSKLDGLPADALSAAAAPELIRDTMGAALVAGANVTLTVNDAGDTITIAAAGGAGGTNATNLTTTGDATSVTVLSDTGTDATIAAATTAAAGVMSAADKTKLNGIATGATANSADSALLDRANHTGSQTASTISNFAATVLATVAAGLSTATNAAIAATDTILGALGKLQAQITAHFGAGGTAHAAATTSTAGFMSAADKTKLDGLSGGADPWTYVKLASDVAISGPGQSTASAITGLSFTPLANTLYSIEALVLISPSNFNNAARLGETWPTSSGAYAGVINESPDAGGQMKSGYGAFGSGVIQSYPVATSTGSANISYPHRIAATMKTGATSTGTFNAAIASNAAGDTFTVKAGSFLRYRTL